jgi:hypothetical protein
MDQFEKEVTKFLNAYMQNRAEDTKLEQERQLFLSAVDYLYALVGGPFTKSGGKGLTLWVPITYATRRYS